MIRQKNKQTKNNKKGERCPLTRGSRRLSSYLRSVGEVCPPGLGSEIGSPSHGCRFWVRRVVLKGFQQKGLI